MVCFSLPNQCRYFGDSSLHSVSSFYIARVVDAHQEPDEKILGNYDHLAIIQGESGLDLDFLRFIFPFGFETKIAGDYPHSIRRIMGNRGH